MKRHTYGPRVVGQEAYEAFKTEEKKGEHKYGKRVTDPDWFPGKHQPVRPAARTNEPLTPEELAKPFVPTLKQSISALEKDLKQVHLISTLEALFTEEQKDQNRKGVYRLLDERKNELLSAQALSIESLNEALKRTVDELDDFIALELTRPLPRIEALELFRDFEVASKGRTEVIDVLSLSMEKLRQRAEEAAASTRAQEADALFDKKPAA